MAFKIIFTSKQTSNATSGNKVWFMQIYFFYINKKKYILVYNTKIFMYVNTITKAGYFIKPLSEISSKKRKKEKKRWK